MQQKEHTTRPNGGFVCSLKFDGTPQHVLANRRQLQDLNRFATNPESSGFPIDFLCWYGSDLSFRTFLRYAIDLQERDTCETQRWKTSLFIFHGSSLCPPQSPHGGL